MTIDDFIQFWDKSNFYSGTKIHNQDYDLLKDKLVENCQNFNDYITFNDDYNVTLLKGTNINE